MNNDKLIRKLQDGLGFALKHNERQGWLVIEDDADDRCATITERVLWDALIEALAAPVAPALAPLSIDQIWSMRALAKDDPRCMDEHWFVLFARAIESAHGIKP